MGIVVVDNSHCNIRHRLVFFVIWGDHRSNLLDTVETVGIASVDGEVEHTRKVVVDIHTAGLVVVGLPVEDKDARGEGLVLVIHRVSVVCWTDRPVECWSW